MSGTAIDLPTLQEVAKITVTAYAERHIFNPRLLLVGLKAFESPENILSRGAKMLLLPGDGRKQPFCTHHNTKVIILLYLLLYRWLLFPEMLIVPTWTEGRRTISGLESCSQG